MLKRLRDWFYTRQRGLKRVASLDATGRVYVKVQAKGTLRPSRVYRAAENAWYTVDPVTSELIKE